MLFAELHTYFGHYRDSLYVIAFLAAIVALWLQVGNKR
jgi:hypothetical protein